MGELKRSKYSIYKYCLVPYCKNTTLKTPNKIFFAVPKNGKVRKKWCKAMHRDENKKQLSSISSLYCCQDHFTLEDDMEDYWEHRLFKSFKQHRLKPGVVPSFFDCQKNVQRRTLRNRKGTSSEDPSYSKNVPSASYTSTKKNKSTLKKKLTNEETSTTSTAGDISETDIDKSPVWNTLLNLQPITSETSAIGVGATPGLCQSDNPVAATSRISSTGANSGVVKRTVRNQRKRLRSPSPKPASQSNPEHPLKLCAVKMEIEDDSSTYSAESFDGSPASSSSQKNKALHFSIDSGSTFVKTEVNEEIVPDLDKIMPPVGNESSGTTTNCNEHPVEAFFKTIAQTVMQFPPHLIDETKTKVSSLIYEMVIRAVKEGCTVST